MLSIVLIPLIQIDADDKLVKTGIITYIVSLIVFDVLAVFVFKGGIFGIALASSLSAYCEFAVIIFHFFKKDIIFKLSLRSIQWKELPNMGSRCITSVAKHFTRTLRSAFMNRIILTIASTAGLTALTVQESIKHFGDSAGLAVACTVFVMSSMFIGEQDKNNIRCLFIRGLKGISIPAGLGVFLAVFSGIIARLFVHGNESTQTIGFAIICYGISLPFVAFNTMFLYYLNGTGHKKLSSAFAIIENGVIIVPCAYILGNIFGTTGLFIAYPISEVIMVIITYIYVAHRKKTLMLKVEDFLLLPDDFGHTEDEEMNRSITTPEEALSASEDAKNFCKEKGVSRSASFNTRLAIEEMCMNIIERGFNDGKSHCIDLRVIVENGTIIIRIRDDCAIFNPSEYLRLHNKYKEDPTSCIGLRVLYASAKKIDYINTMNMNNLIIVSEQKSSE